MMAKSYFMISSLFRRFFYTTPMVSADTKAKVQELIKTKPVFIASKVCFQLLESLKLGFLEV